MSSSGQHERSKAAIFTEVYSFRWQTFDDPRLQQVFGIIDDLQKISTTGSSNLPDVYQILRRLPAWLYPMTARAIKHRAYESKIYSNFFQPVKHAIINKSPTAPACTIEDILTAQEQEGFSDAFAATIASDLFEAGSETTSSELYGFAQAMLLYPETQRKAQAEIDALCGDRCPSLDDLSNLPYTRACVKETLRWMPAAAIGIPHALTEDDEYKGYKLPAGAIVMINIWAIHRDPARYPEPTKFSPERFLGDDTTAAESFALSDASKRDHYAFGSGRRVCPGIHLAERSMSLVIARMLWAFEFRPEVDGVLPKQDDFVQGMAVHPKKFGAEIRVRKGRERVVEGMWREVEGGLDGRGQYLGNPI